MREYPPLFTLFYSDWICLATILSKQFSTSGQMIRPFCNTNCSTAFAYVIEHNDLCCIVAALSFKAAVSPVANTAGLLSVIASFGKGNNLFLSVVCGRFHRAVRSCYHIIAAKIANRLVLNSYGQVSDRDPLLLVCVKCAVLHAPKCCCPSNRGTFEDLKIPSEEQSILRSSF